MNTPSVNFHFENNNLSPAVPSQGVTNVLAVTTKGPFEEPTLCETFSAFQKIFGKEIVPDGTVSNIERALKMGSKVRVCRVAGGEIIAAVKASNIQTNKFKIEAVTAGIDGNSLSYSIAVDGTGTATAVLSNNHVTITLLSTAKTVGDLITLLAANATIRASLNGTATNATEVTAVVSTPLTGGANQTSSATYGYAKDWDDQNMVTTGSVPLKYILYLIDPLDEDNKIYLSFYLRTKEKGSNIVSEYGYNLDRNFWVQAYELISNGICRTYLKQYTRMLPGTNLPDPNSVLNTSLLLTSTSVVTSGVETMVDAQSLVDFISNTPNITLEFVEAQGFNSIDVTNITDLDSAIDCVREHKNWLGYFTMDNDPIEAPNSSIMSEGTTGGATTATTWLTAYNKIKGEDAYHLICSHMHQHIASDYVATIKTIAESVVSLFDTELFIEIPKKNSDGTFRTADETKTALDTMKATIGYHKNIAYFGGGIKLFDSNGSLKKSDVLGTVIGLADVSATQYGPYFSFANENRGLVLDAQGPVIENLGSPAMIDTLNEFANSRINLFIVKETMNAGKQTMMWHNFTSTNIDNSDKFLSIIGLQLYLKKTLKPRLEKYLEEPNTFSTWKDMFITNKGIFENLIGVAITEYTWYGDQDATKYSQLVVNNEVDVRKGKYVIKVSYKEIVTLQTIDMYLTIDTANNTVSIN